MARADYLVGIDLGTTHTVMACCPLDGSAEPAVVPIAQPVGPGQVARRPLLPSLLYAPTAAEPTPAGWDLDGWIAGELGRARGGETSGRQIASAKSWLSHAEVDRRAEILPWRLSEQADDAAVVKRISPLRASSLLLEHLARAFHLHTEGSALAAQEVVLTVPASFDAVARSLTVEAAGAVGLKVRLLEEPQAACYSLLWRQRESMLAEVLAGKSEALVLVCDVGGGTTDLSLMRVRRRQSALAVDRLAVGPHLLLGGDNMDLALAHLCEGRLVADGARLAPDRFAALGAACRRGKERLLGPDAPVTVEVALLGRGSQLVGGALRTRLGRDEVSELVLDAFFPVVPFDEQTAAPRRAAIVAFGLPYERDVAITRHLRAFLRRHAEVFPAALLLNGGVFRSAAVTGRVAAVLGGWRGTPLRVLSAPHPDTAVALGAVVYGLALRQRAPRIGGGSARAYFLRLGAAAGASAAGARGVCVLPRGAEPGTPYRIDDQGFALTVGQASRFDLFACDEGSDRPGGVVKLDEPRMRMLAPLVTTLPARGGSGSVRVRLQAQLSAVGTLEIACSPSRTPSAGDAVESFELAFELRGGDGGVGAVAAASPRRLGSRLEQAKQALLQVFGKCQAPATERDVKDLIRSLEKVVGKRSRWDASLSRALFDALLVLRRGRRRSAHHERQFWSLAGYCLRPGSGMPGDAERVAALFELFEQRLTHRAEKRSWQQFWIAWRRVAAGLDARAQARLREVVDPFLAPAAEHRKKLKGYRNEAAAEMLELGASLERVSAKSRAALGGWVLDRTWTERDPRLWAALGRVGARQPIYGSAHQVVPAHTVERWMDHLARERWDRIATAPAAAIAMCRITGDRSRDVRERTRQQVDERLAELGLSPDERLPLRERVPVAARDRTAFFGAELPAGLQLAPPSDSD